MGIPGGPASALGLLLHHAESVDPTLIDWIKDRIDHIFGLGPATIVAILGVITLAFPIGLMTLALRRKRSMRPRPDGEPPNAAAR